MTSLWEMLWNTHYVFDKSNMFICNDSYIVSVPAEFWGVLYEQRLDKAVSGLYNGYAIHDDVIKWKHFPYHWPFVRENHHPLIKTSDAELWSFLWSAPEQMVG